MDFEEMLAEFRKATEALIGVTVTHLRLQEAQLKLADKLAEAGKALFDADVYGEAAASADFDAALHAYWEARGK